MITSAREDGYDVAADNLERFLDGTGGVKKLSVSWLRGFESVLDAEEKNRERFEGSLSDIADKMKDNSTRNFHDYWDRSLTASQFGELYYASGTSTITSHGNFKLVMNGEYVTITGIVKHRWWDPYNWHAGLAAYIPGFGSISDEDALLLQKHRGAAPFRMEAHWSQKLSAKIKIIDYWFNDENFQWKGP
ncbi:MAG: hypothetical protein ABUK01_10390 [Leptospirales bacterium]